MRLTMIKLPEPAKRPTMYFVGVTTGQSSIMKMFPIWAKELGLDAIHDTVHEMARDEARHGKAFEGLLKRYFG